MTAPPTTADLAALLPAGVAVATATDPAEAGPLLPEEAAAVAGAVASRRQEFALSRHCARRALASLGVRAGPLLPGPHREPRWPAGVVGSITHCDGFAAAAVARASAVASIGIDAEPDAPLPEGVAPLVTLPDEQAWLGELAGTGTVAWDRLVFSAKESVYKAWFPLTGRWLGFDEARVSVDPGGAFRADLLTPVAMDGWVLGGFDGRWAATGGHLLTAVTVPIPV